MYIRFCAAALAAVVLSGRDRVPTVAESTGRFFVTAGLGTNVHLYSKSGRFSIGNDAPTAHADTVAIKDSATVFFDTAEGDLQVLIQTLPGVPVRMRGYDSAGRPMVSLLLSRSFTIGRTGFVLNVQSRSGLRR
jgi:hypothetical protein